METTQQAASAMKDAINPGDHVTDWLDVYALADQGIATVDYLGDGIRVTWADGSAVTQAPGADWIVWPSDCSQTELEEHDQAAFLMAQATRMIFPRSSGYEIKEEPKAGASEWHVWHNGAYERTFRKCENAEDWITYQEHLLHDINS